MDKYAKDWGFTSEIFTHDNISIHRIEVVRKGTCSKHCHQYKYNKFFVESGNIIVYRWEKEKKIGTLLQAGNTIDIAPNIYHQFEALEDSVVYEIYYTKINNEDIIREKNV
jgi:quercetin dioxygenase-like cupin family protein